MKKRSPEKMPPVSAEEYGRALRGIGFNTSLDANMGNARTNRANLQGAAAAQYTNNASQI